MGYGDRVEQHTHDSYDVHGVAQEHHQHYDIENRADGLRADLNALYERIGCLEDRVDTLERERING